MKFELKKILQVGKSPANHADRVLVIDGADVVGHRVVERLIDAECTNLRVGFRALPKEVEESRGVETVQFVWEDETTYSDALKDVTTVFVTLPLKPTNWDAHFPRFCKACKANKVKRVVKLSFFHSIKGNGQSNPRYFSDAGYHDAPFARKHALCDGDLVIYKGLNATILFAAHLMSNVFRYDFQRSALIEKREFYGASGGRRVNYVSPNDVADVAVSAILQKTHKGRQGYTLSGPSLVTDGEVAARLSEALGAEITYVEKPLRFFDKTVASLERTKAECRARVPKCDARRVLGRDAESFADYLRATDRMTPIERSVMSEYAERMRPGGKLDEGDALQAVEKLRSDDEEKKVKEENEMGQ